HGVARVAALAGDLGHPLELGRGELAKQRDLLEDGRYRHAGVPWGWRAYGGASLRSGVPGVNVASCRQLMTPVIFPDFVSSEHLARIQCSETRDSPRLPARPSPVRLRKQLRDAVHDTRDRSEERRVGKEGRCRGPE